MSKGNTYENDYLLLVFNNTAIALIGDATGLRGSSSAGSLYVSLHTADPGESGNQSTNEATYTSYARVAVARSSAGWTVSGNQVSNTAVITFPTCTGGSNTITHVGIGTDSSGTGKLLYRAPLIPASPLLFTATTSDVITVPGHSLVVNDTIIFITALGGTLPTGITEGTIYYVKTVSGNDITIAATQGGSAIDLTAAGAGLVARISTLAVSQNIFPQFAAGQLVINED